jgi:RNA 3'-terminal phosphate cyclase
LALTAAAIALGALGLIADPVGEDAAEALLGFAVIGGAILALSLVGRSW